MHSYRQIVPAAGHTSVVMFGSLIAAATLAGCGSSDDGSAEINQAVSTVTRNTYGTAADASGEPGVVTALPSSPTPTSADGAAGAPSDQADDPSGEQRFPDVIDATAALDGELWTFSVTISSPYDTPERYADAWRVVGPDGTVFGERILTHDHAAEQPFTRSLSGVEIPDNVDEVTIEGRDLKNGYGGATFDLVLDRSG